MITQSSKDNDMITYTIYCTNRQTGEEFDFDLEACSRSHALAICEQDFNDTITIDYIMDKR